ncbi:MAG: AAA family ATPase [Bacteroidetes bacterium]|nr:AAA family ATPase [Bacteroidota bacterium]
MAVIGRKKELEVMDRLLRSNDSEFLAVYGRRRVGKTYLIRERFGKQIVFDCTGLFNAGMNEQLLNFWIELGKVYPVAAKKPAPDSWLLAFQFLEKYIIRLTSRRKKKKVVFFDEISWYDTPRSGFMAAFTQFWNSFCSKRSDVLLVICGSAASWIINRVIRNRGGLHNRLTQTIRLEAFDLGETRAYLRHRNVKLTNKDIVQLYMCIGGIPYYLKQVQPGKGISQILNELFFNKNAGLRTEYENLYASLFKNYRLHERLVKVLAAKGRGLTRNEIIEATKLPSGGGLTTVLEELEECGFIANTSDMGKKREDRLYRLTDEYTLFYFKFLHNPASVKNGAALAGSQSFKIWSGIAFENICFKHHKIIAALLGIGGIQYNVYSFIDKGTAHTKGCQIDLIFDQSDNVINIIEAKFLNTPLVINKAYEQELFNKLSCIERKSNSRKNIFITIISAKGTLKNEHFYSSVNHEIVIDEIFDYSE